MKITEITQPDLSPATALPVFISPVQAGFPSPADNEIENKLDLNALLIKHPAATFFVKVEGESMIGANIHSGDILIVDRSLNVCCGKIVIAVVNGEFTVKRYTKNKEGVFLSPENKKYPALKIEQDTDFQVWGVVTYVIHKAC